jgi:hypothetical protein
MLVMFQIMLFQKSSWQFHAIYLMNLMGKWSFSVPLLKCF